MATMTFLKLTRMARGITLDELSRMAAENGFFYSRFHFARIENADYNIKKEVQEFIADALKISRASLFNDQGGARTIKKKTLRKIEKLMLARGET